MWHGALRKVGQGGSGKLEEMPSVHIKGVAREAPQAGEAPCSLHYCNSLAWEAEMILLST